jgi:hypothetical protein
MASICSAAFIAIFGGPDDHSFFKELKEEDIVALRVTLRPH